MRIFIALDIPGEIRARIIEYAERARALASEARWARPEGLHVTLKFIGEVSESRLEQIKTALARVRAAPFDVAFEKAGFFPNSKGPRVFWIGVEGGPALPRLAALIEDATHAIGIPKEERTYSPHLTLARSGSGPGGQHQLKPLATLLHDHASPQFGTMTARDFFLYLSKPQRGGSQYTKLQRFELA